jgi:response regulator of citrate/malate metabolism
MNQLEIFLLLNSAFLAIIGYFLKDMHREFKILVDRVNKVYTDFYAHQQMMEALKTFYQKQIDQLEKRLEKLESKHEQDQD